MRIARSVRLAVRLARSIWLGGVLALAARCPSLAGAGEPVTIENVSAPGPNDPAEPYAKEFSLEKAVRFLDSAALTWQKSQGCFTCHTNYAYLLARPSISAAAPAHAEVRAFAEKLVRERWESKGPRWDAEVVATGAFLALNDAAATGKLHETTRRALDRAWTVQKDDGGFDWLKCGWPPMESDDHYGVTLAAIGAGAAPEGYLNTPKAREGIEKIRRYLKANPPPTLHHKAMVLWASTYVDGLMAPQEREACIRELSSLQKEDGGWGAATLGDWKRSDGKEQDRASSDGYGTGFVVYVLRRSGVPSSDPRIRRGLEWLKTHQRESGRWFTRSLNQDNRHYLSHAGTAFAVLALASSVD